MELHTILELCKELAEKRREEAEQEGPGSYLCGHYAGEAAAFEVVAAWLEKEKGHRRNYLEH